MPTARPQHSTLPRAAATPPGGTLARLQWMLPLGVLALAVGLGLWLLSAERRGRRGELEAEARARLEAATTVVANNALRALAQLEEATADLVVRADGSVAKPTPPTQLFLLDRQLQSDERILLQLSDSLAAQGNLEGALADTSGLAADAALRPQVRLLARLRAAGFASRAQREERALELRQEALAPFFGGLNLREQARPQAEGDPTAPAPEEQVAKPSQDSAAPQDPALPPDWRWDREVFAARMLLTPKDPLFATDLLALVGGPDEALALALASGTEPLKAQQRSITLRRAFERMVAARPGILVGRSEAGRAWFEGSRRWLVRAESGGERRFVKCDLRSSGNAELRLGLPEPRVQVQALDPEQARASAKDQPAPQSSAESGFRAEKRIGLPFPEARATLTLPEATVSAELEARAWRVVLLFAPAALLVAAALALALRAFARQAAESRARAELVARVGHELRTPLAALRLSVETLASGRAERPEEIREFAQLAVEEAERLAGRVTHALDLGRLVSHGDGPLETLDLRALCADALETARPLASAKAARLEGILPAEAVAIRGDATALRAALLCLIDNALRHGGELGHVAVALEPGGSHASLIVSDDGQGWPVDDPRTLLGRFVRGAPAGVAGAGLGLALVAEVAERHSAELSLGRSDAGGARIAITFSPAP